MIRMRSIREYNVIWSFTRKRDASPPLTNRAVDFEGNRDRIRKAKTEDALSKSRAVSPQEKRLFPHVNSAHN